MTHPSEEQLSAFVDGVLGPDGADRLNNHLIACPGCRRKVAELRAVVQAVHDLPRPAAPPSLRGSIMNLVHEAEGPAPGTGSGHGPLTAAAAARDDSRRRWISAAMVAGFALFIMLAGPRIYEMAAPPEGAGSGFSPSTAFYSGRDDMGGGGEGALLSEPARESAFPESDEGGAPLPSESAGSVGSSEESGPSGLHPSEGSGDPESREAPGGGQTGPGGGTRGTAPDHDVGAASSDGEHAGGSGAASPGEGGENPAPAESAPGAGGGSVPASEDGGDDGGHHAAAAGIGTAGTADGPGGPDGAAFDPGGSEPGGAAHAEDDEEKEEEDDDGENGGAGGEVPEPEISEPGVPGAGETPDSMGPGSGGSRTGGAAGISSAAGAGPEGRRPGAVLPSREGAADPSASRSAAGPEASPSAGLLRAAAPDGNSARGGESSSVRVSVPGSPPSSAGEPAGAGATAAGRGEIRADLRADPTVEAGDGPPPPESGNVRSSSPGTRRDGGGAGARSTAAGGEQDRAAGEPSAFPGVGSPGSRGAAVPPAGSGDGGGDGDNAGGAGITSTGGSPARRENGAESIVSAAPGGGEAVGDAGALSPAGFDLQKTAGSGSMVLEVRDVGRAHGHAVAVAEARGGLVEESRLGDAEAPGAGRSAFLIIRVPRGTLTDVMDDLSHLGTVRMQTAASRHDIAAQYIHAESRLRTMEAQEERYLTLLGEADTASEMLQIENELWRLRSDIESVLGRMALWDFEMQTAPLELTLEQAPAGAAAFFHPVSATVVQAGIRLGEGFQAVVFSGAWALPWLLVMALAAWIWRRVWAG